jgi:hypothetical protein
MIDEALYEYIREESKRTGIPMNLISNDLLAHAIATRRGEVIEQQSLPVIREIVQTELKKALAQQRMDLREDIGLEMTNEIKAIHRASDNRLAALLVRAIRDAGIGRRLAYTLLARSFGPDFAAKAYTDAREKTGKELANKGDEV